MKAGRPARQTGNVRRWGDQTAKDVHQGAWTCPSPRLTVATNSPAWMSGTAPQHHLHHRLLAAAARVLRGSAQGGSGARLGSQVNLRALVGAAFGHPGPRPRPAPQALRSGGRLRTPAWISRGSIGSISLLTRPPGNGPVSAPGMGSRGASGTCSRPGGRGDDADLRGHLGHPAHRRRCPIEQHRVGHRLAGSGHRRCRPAPPGAGAPAGSGARYRSTAAAWPHHVRRVG